MITDKLIIVQNKINLLGSFLFPNIITMKIASASVKKMIPKGLRNLLEIGVKIPPVPFAQ